MSCPRDCPARYIAIFWDSANIFILQRLSVFCERSSFGWNKQVRRRLYGLLLLMLLATGGVLAWAALAPVKVDSQEALFEIPKGTWARRMAGDKVDILPDTIYLTLGLQDILWLKNSDEVPQIFGPTLIMPAQNFKLPFEAAAEYLFVCSAHSSGQMTIIVDPEPVRGLERLKWRIRKLARTAAAKLSFADGEAEAVAPDAPVLTESKNKG
jgi:hypothetical protein